MEIAEAKIEDLLSIQRLSIQLGYDCPTDNLKKKLVEVLSNDEHKLLIAKMPKSDNVIGYIHIERYRTLYSDDLINIMGIVVDDEYRNKGIGAELLKSAEHLALEWNCIGIRACSSSYRYRAHCFYEKSGFDSMKEQKTYVKKL